MIQIKIRTENLTNMQNNFLAAIALWVVRWHTVLLHYESWFEDLSWSCSLSHTSLPVNSKLSYHKVKNEKNV